MACCSFKACPFPAVYTYRDIRGDVIVCEQHARFLNDENDHRDHDKPILESFVEEAKKRPSIPTISKETHRTVDDDLSFHGRHPVWKSNQRKANALTRFAEKAARIRERLLRRENLQLAKLAKREEVLHRRIEREQEVKDIECRKMAIELRLQVALLRYRKNTQIFRIKTLQVERRLHHWSLFRQANLCRWIQLGQMRDAARAARVRQLAAAREVRRREIERRKELREKNNPPKWTPVLKELADLPIGGRTFYKLEGRKPKELRTMISLSNRTSQWKFRTKTIGDCVTIEKVSQYWQVQ